MPRNLVPRHKELNQIAQCILRTSATLRSNNSNIVFITNDVCPIGGSIVGKSVLAACACDLPVVRSLFGNRIYWVACDEFTNVDHMNINNDSVSKASFDTLLVLQILISCISEQVQIPLLSCMEQEVPKRLPIVPPSSYFSSVEQCQAYLCILLSMNEISRDSDESQLHHLLVLDGVCSASVVQSFEKLNLSILVTSRDENLPSKLYDNKKASNSSHSVPLSLNIVHVPPFTNRFDKELMCTSIFKSFKINPSL